jgi:UDP-N-acetylmuramoyl-tripeptide--D-alanyl-D-alanine ligase
MFFSLKGENFDGNKFAKQAINAGAKYAIIDNQNFHIESQTILVDNVLETLQELATYHRDYLGTKIIALTGSNGKTTTKELINAVLSKKFKTIATKGNLNNHIGVPLTLLNLTKDTEIGIIEMGANHQKEIEFLCSITKPDYGYITNFGKAHLEGFGGIKGVIKGKSEMYDHLINNDKSIFVNMDDPLQLNKTEFANTIKFGTKPNATSTRIELESSNPFVNVIFNSLEIKSNLIGEYNFGNISAAIAIGNYFNVAKENIKYAIEEYVPNNNRSQIISVGSNKIILDAYNANPSSMEVALNNFNKQDHKNKIIFLGDMFELGKDAAKEHKFILDLVKSMAFEKCFFLGENFYKQQFKDRTFKFFKTFEDYKTNSINFSCNDALILIKGSRGMALERIVELLKR